MNNVSIWSVPSYEDPFLDLPLPWRERIEVRGSFCLFWWFVCFVHFVREEGLSGHAAERQGFGLQEILAYLVCFVIARNKVTKQSSCFAAGFGFRIQGVTSTKMVIARAKPVAIYDFPLFFS